jgi:hypothetical protein
MDYQLHAGDVGVALTFQACGFVGCERYQAISVLEVIVI